MIELLYIIEICLVKLGNNIPGNLPVDKKLHLIAGFLMTLIVGLFNPLLGIIVCVLIAGAKELIDFLSKKGCPELNDFLATVVGGMLAYIPIMLIRLL